MPQSLRTQNGISLIEISLCLALISILVTFLGVSFRSTSQAAMQSKAHDIKQEIKLLTDSIYMQAMADGQLGLQGKITHNQDGHPIHIPLKYGYPSAKADLFAFFYQDNPQIQIHTASQVREIKTPRHGQNKLGCVVEIGPEILAIQVHDQIITYDTGFELGSAPKIIVNPCLKHSEPLQNLSEKEIAKPVASENAQKQMHQIRSWIDRVNKNIQIQSNSQELGIYKLSNQRVTTKYGWLQAKSANFPKDIIGESTMYNKKNELKFIERCHMTIKNHRMLIIITANNEMLKYDMSTVKSFEEGKPEVSYTGICQ